MPPENIEQVNRYILGLIEIIIIVTVVCFLVLLVYYLRSVSRKRKMQILADNLGLSLRKTSVKFFRIPGGSRGDNYIKGELKGNKILIHDIIGPIASDFGAISYTIIDFAGKTYKINGAFFTYLPGVRKIEEKITELLKSK